MNRARSRMVMVSLYGVFLFSRRWYLSSCMCVDLSTRVGLSIGND